MFHGVEHELTHKTPTTDFRKYLQRELVRRIQANPKYSLRAFAKRLGIAPSLLSKILHEKVGITLKMFTRISQHLDLNPQEVTAFREFLGASKHTKRRTVPRNGSQYDANDFEDLSLESFQIMADWYHFAILELTYVNGFQPNPKWIAHALGISVPEVNAAVERLKRLEMLVIDKAGTWTDQSEFVTTLHSHLTSAAQRKHQKQVLSQAQKALEDIPIELRDQTSVTMAIPVSELPLIKEKIKTFRRDLCASLALNPTKDEVYQLAISLFPISKTTPPSRKENKNEK